MRRKPLLLMVFLMPFLASTGAAPVEFMPVDDLRPGMKGIGKTVFHGTEVKDFDVEVVGVLKNARPKSDLILLELSGGPLEESGVIAGMSGSPVYVDGKLVGAIAYALGIFQKKPLAAAVPIEEILSSKDFGAVGMGRPRFESFGDITPIATPVVFSGFDPRATRWSASPLEQFGLIPVAGGGKRGGESSPLIPGSVLAIRLLDGDFEMSAIGTLTHLEGNKFYAWGHPMFHTGKTELPATGGYVHTILKSSMTSYKIASATEGLGAVLEDRFSGISGSLDARAKVLPLNITVDSDEGVSDYKINVILNRALTPSLFAIAVMNSAMVSGNIRGELTINSDITISLEGHDAIRFRETYSDSLAIFGLARDATDIMAVLMGNAFEKVTFNNVDIKLVLTNKSKRAYIADAFVSKRIADPGDTIVVTIRLKPHAQEKYVKTAHLVIPEDSPPGDVTIIVADGATAAGEETRRQPFKGKPRNLDELIERIGSQRPSNSIVVTMYIPGKIVSVPEGEMPSLPPSFLSVIQKTQSRDLMEASNIISSERVIETEDVISGRRELKVRVEEK